MATLGVPFPYPTISAAVAAAAPADTIVIAGHYAGNEAVSVTVDNLTFSAHALVQGIVLTAAAGILKITLAEASPIQIIGNSGDNTFTGNSGANIITDGGGGNDILKGGSGNDTMTVTGGTDTVDGGTGSDDLLIVDYSTATASVFTSSGTVSDGGTRTVSYKSVDRLQITGGSGDDTLTAQAAGKGTDILSGGNGNDTIANSGTDSLWGDAGDDTFQISHNVGGTADGGTGTDTVRGYDLGGFSFTNVEVLDAVSGGGTVLATTAQLASFGSITDSGAAADSEILLYFRGAGGTLDLSAVDVGAHTFQVGDNGVTSGYNVTGAANGDTLYGSSYDDTLDGGAGNDMIVNSGGTDTLKGDTGDDIFEITTGAGTIDGGIGTDTVLGYDLGGFSFSNVEVLDAALGGRTVHGTTAQLASFGSITASGFAADAEIWFYLRGAGGTLDLSTVDAGLHSFAIRDAGVTSGYAITGSANADTIGGSSFDDLLAGGGGHDTLEGGGGTDTVVVGASWLQTAIAEGPAAVYQLTVGADMLTASDVEQFQFTNGTFAAGAIVNDGPVGIDDAAGGLVQASEAGGPGTPGASGNVLSNDTDADMPLGDFLTVTGARAGTEAEGGALTGVSGSTVIVGTYGSLTVDPNGGWSYALDNSDPDTRALDQGQTVTETFTYGVTDAKGLSDTAQLDLTITGTAEPLVAVADKGYVSRGGITIPAAAAAAALLTNDSGAGPLTLHSVANATGGTVVLDGNGNLVITASTDPAMTTGGFDYTVADNGGTGSAHVTLGLVTTSSANNTLTVATLAGEFSFIDGLAGIDHLTGGAGSDTFWGGAGNDTLNGGAGDDLLDGGVGLDTLTGGTGDDSYVVDGSGDKAIELANEGSDSVLSSVNYTLAANLELLQMFGANLTGRGNALANTLLGDASLGSKLYGLDGDDDLVGGSGADTFDGGTGADTMFGRAGDDTYTVDDAGDVVREDSTPGVDDGGVDAVKASVSYTLGAFVENLTLTGAAAIDGTGNELANTIKGNTSTAAPAPTC
jgi:VCBS repeat-containing protein